MIELQNGVPVDVPIPPPAPPTSTPSEPTGTVVNSPITWPQLIGGWMSDAPVFLLAALPLIATWLQSAPFSEKGLITVLILAIVAGLTAVLRKTGTDGLSLRLRANGQILGGR